ncbi:MAG: PqqD family protein [Bacteroidales bacterium]|nr:PqqD family protein [Bacteroidales bacterium]MCF8389694.1 PqqD family protein [Bacteroidales bacterium]
MKIKRNIAISESGFLFDPSTGESFTFNPVGLEIFNYLRSEKSLDEIKEIVIEKYDIDASNFERYYFDFTSMLNQYHLLENERS